MHQTPRPLASCESNGHMLTSHRLHNRKLAGWTCRFTHISGMKLAFEMQIWFWPWICFSFVAANSVKLTLKEKNGLILDSVQPFAWIRSDWDSTARAPRCHYKIWPIVIWDRTTHSEGQITKRASQTRSLFQSLPRLHTQKPLLAATEAE